jgi:hypothetical protein
LYPGCTSLPAVTNTTVNGNIIFGQFGDDAVNGDNFNGLTVTNNDIGGFQENGQHQDVFQSTWGGSNFTWNHNYIHDYCGEAMILKDGDVYNVQINDNVWLRSESCPNAPGGEDGQIMGVHNLSMNHNTFADNSGGGYWNFRFTGSSAVSVHDNVFDGYEYPDPGTDFPTVATEGDNVFQQAPWSFNIASSDKVIPNPAWANPGNDDYRITGYTAPDGHVPGIDYSPKGQQYGPN